MTERHPVVVVGGGPAGLATAAECRRRGLDVVVLDRGARIGDSWRRHYDALKLHTHRRLSALPGLPFPKQEGPWVHRDGVARYLEAFALEHRLEVRLGVTVRALRREGEAWCLETTAGPLEAEAVVVATGYNHTPRLPDWPGRRQFTGELIHSLEYRNAAPYRGRDVLVVGVGNSATEITLDLAAGGAGKLWLSVRTPPNIVRRDPIPNPLLGILVRPLPVPVVDRLQRVIERVTVGDLSEFGLPPAPRGVYTRVLEGAIPIVDTGIVAAVRSRRVEVVPAVEGFAGDEVLLAGGGRLRPAAVIAATGFAQNLEPLVGDLGLVGADGRPLVHGDRTDPRAPRLYFNGYVNPISGNLREVGLDARRIARAIAAELTPASSKPAA